MQIAVVTTFPNSAWDVYAKRMLQSFVQYWPSDVPLLVQLDDDSLFESVDAILREQDAIAVGPDPEHKAFIERNADKDHPTDYRKQVVRFCHKPFALLRAIDAVGKQKLIDAASVPRYLIWMDADVITTKEVTFDLLKKCLPTEECAVAYLGRKDWDHSETGWLAFDLENGGEDIIKHVCDYYTSDGIFDLEQWHDSWVWDTEMKNHPRTNLTPAKPGTEIWEQSPMADWSKHYKGPAAKSTLMGEPKYAKTANGSNFVIQTKNAIPNEQIRQHIRENQALITKWIGYCAKTDEELVVVSAGPTLIAEDLYPEIEAGRKIVAVKHAIEPLQKAGIKPWACMLLDPRPHVLDFVNDADPDILWFVASQCNPEVTKMLIDKGCQVIGYHASVNAGEHVETSLQPQAVVSGGSATATRGLYVLHHLGFSKFRLYGYDLCYPDKPNFDEKDELGQQKYLEISLGINDPTLSLKKCFWTKPELIAQYEEISDIIKKKIFDIVAFGDGVVPFILKCYNVSNLRNDALKAKMVGNNPPTYSELIYGTKPDS